MWGRRGEEERREERRGEYLEIPVRDLHSGINLLLEGSEGIF